MLDPIVLQDAYRRGDLEAFKVALGDPPDFPNTRNPRGFGAGYLEAAIYHSPLPFIRTLLGLGADPHARTQVDDYATPLEEAAILGRATAVQRLRQSAR
jgi:hypothetical protein